MKKTSLRDFLEKSPFADYLESCWNGKYYGNDPVASGRTGYDPGGVCAHALFYLIYAERLQLANARPGRAAALTRFLSDMVAPDGYCRTEDGISDHPAYASTIGDALGTAVCYAEQIGLESEDRENALAALRRMAENHHRLRFPEGAQGLTQQLRFELRIYYWLLLLSPDPVWKSRFQTALDRGIFRYTHPAAVNGPLIQPSLNPDWTWNYVCTGGLTDQHATNTHTPAYYCTEPNGFMFVYLHALRNGVFGRRADFDWLCGNYIGGLFRNLSRGGHLASDLDGYGIHRAWYSPVLIEGIPLEATMMAQELGMEREARQLRWYVDRYLDFVQKSPSYAQSGLPEMQPFGQRIGIEAQFSQLAGTRFYGSIARALVEYPGIDEMEPEEMPPFGSFAWDAEWLRISTPSYETSFAGHTSLRNIPVVPCYGDPNLGSLIGGAPVSTLFSRGELLYAAGFPVSGLWHIESEDHNGRRFISCSTSPQDESETIVRASDGEMLSGADFAPYDAPCNLTIPEDGFIEMLWRRRNRADHFDYSVHSRYYRDYVDIDWRMKGMAGHYWDRISFVIPLPDESAEFSLNGKLFAPLQEYRGGEIRCLRWHKGASVCEVELQTMPKGRLREVQLVRLPSDKGNPGGTDHASPSPIVQVRIVVIPAVTDREWRLSCRLSFC